MMIRHFVSASLGLAVALGFAAATASLAQAADCAQAEAKHRGNVRWCEQELAKCVRGVEEGLSQRGKNVDADSTPQGQVCNRAYDACMSKSDANLHKANCAN